MTISRDAIHSDSVDVLHPQDVQFLSQNFEIQDWGLVPYGEAVTQQLELVEKKIAARTQVRDKIIFCSHPPVVTIGRGTKAGDVFGWSGEIYESSRGGRATYHGPSQIVVYPILDLTQLDLHKYIRALEKAIVNTLKEFSIESEARTIKPTDDSPSLTGVWVNDKKIASIGIAVKKSVTYHGLALNVINDPAAFTGINPCGFKSDIMTSVEKVLRQRTETLNFINIEVVKSELARQMIIELSNLRG